MFNYNSNSEFKLKIKIDFLKKEAKSLNIILLVLILLVNCTSKALIRRANYHPINIQSIDSFEYANNLTYREIRFQSKELKKENETSSVKAENTISESFPFKFNEAVLKNFEKLDFEEIPVSGGFYIEGNNFYLSNEFNKIYTLNIHSINSMAKDIEFLIYDSDIGFSYKINSFKSYTILKKKYKAGDFPTLYYSMLCDDCKERIKKSFPLTKVNLNQEMLVSIINNNSEIQKLYKIKLKPNYFLLNRYFEIHELNLIELRAIWFVFFPFALAWDILTLPVQLIWEFILVYSFAKSYS